MMKEDALVPHHGVPLAHAAMGQLHRVGACSQAGNVSYGLAAGHHERGGSHHLATAHVQQAPLRCRIGAIVGDRQ